MKAALAAGAMLCLFAGGADAQQLIARPVPVEVVAESALAIRVDDRIGEGLEIFAKNIDERRPVASTQKLLTALVIAEGGGLDEKVPVKRTDRQVPPRNLWITEGSSYRRGDLLEMMLVRSYNDVTRCLARDHSGSQDAFVAAMNRRATGLGMEDSKFLNPHGLTVEGQYSTARDMMRLALAAWRNDEIRRIVRIRRTTFTYTGGNTVPVENSNDLLRRWPACSGMKTGFTAAAGRCLVGAAEENGKTALVVVLGSTGEAVWDDAERLLRLALDF